MLMVTAPFQAVVVLKGDSAASGIVTFTQASSTAPVVITGQLTGLDASALRGFHVQCADVF